MNLIHLTKLNPILLQYVDLLHQGVLQLHQQHTDFSPFPSRLLHFCTCWYTVLTNWYVLMSCISWTWRLGKWLPPNTTGRVNMKFFWFIIHQLHPETPSFTCKFYTAKKVLQQFGNRRRSLRFPNSVLPPRRYKTVLNHVSLVYLEFFVPSSFLDGRKNRW